MNKKLKVTAVSYLNTIPFVYGLQNERYKDFFDLSLDVPSECSRKILQGEVDVGLVPTYTIVKNPNFRIITNHCIGAVDYVRTVALLSNTPLESIQKVYLDTHSQTSVNLVKILAALHWKIEVEWISTDIASLALPLSSNSAILAIGDKVFSLEQHFNSKLDLAAEWKDFTGLPMVFAAWITEKQLPLDLENALKQALDFGVNHTEDAVDVLNGLKISREEAVFYLTSNISYDLDDAKRESMKRYSNYITQLNL